MYNKRNIGNEYENKAVEYLKNSGYRIIERNFYCKQGEIDIIARDEKYLVIIEVKYRRDDKKGNPKESVNYYKKNKIIKATKYYLYKNHIGEDTSVRFDVVSILDNNIEHIKDAFWIEWKDYVVI